MRSAAASTSSDSTIVLATASNVASSDRLSANARGDLVQRAQALGGLAFGIQRLLALGAESLRPLVQGRVLHRDGELSAQRAQQRLLVLGQVAAALGIDGQQPDQLVACSRRHGDRRLQPDLLERVANAGQARVARRVGDVQDAVRSGRPERELEQPLADGRVRSREAACGRRLERTSSSSTR